jgi:FemAB-related protein (PEP-CTERM system-associated)
MIRIQIDTTTSVNQPLWDAYVAAHPQATHYHLSGWGKVVERVYRYPALYFSAWEAERLVGVLPLVIFGGLLRRKSVVSMPYLDYGGLCVDSPAIGHELYDAVGRELHNRRIDLLDLRHRWATALPLRNYGDKVTMILPLASDAEGMWKAFGAKLRNQIRKAEKENLLAQWTGSLGVHDFYAVYLHNMRDLGSPPHSMKFFQQILTTFPATQLLLVRLGNQVIGGGLCLVFRDTMLVPWASSLRPYFRLCPNNLLYWEALRSGCDRGLQQFDFGRSSHGSGTYSFKKQWGALEEPLYWQATMAGGDLINEESHAGLSRVVEVWKRLPVEVTRVIGPLVRRRLSN